MPSITESAVYDFPKNSNVSTLYDGFENTVPDTTLWTQTITGAGTGIAKEAVTLGTYATGSNRAKVTIPTGSDSWTLQSKLIPQCASIVARVRLLYTNGSTFSVSFGNDTDGWTTVTPILPTLAGGAQFDFSVFVLYNGDGTYSLYSLGGDSCGVSLPNGAQIKFYGVGSGIYGLIVYLDEVRYVF